MRKFGVDNPEVFRFQIGEDESVYEIPLAASLPAKVLIGMRNAQKQGEADLFEFQFNMLMRYTDGAVEDLPTAVIGDILRAWSAESNGQGASLGESSASSES